MTGAETVVRRPQTTARKAAAALIVVMAVLSGWQSVASWFAEKQQVERLVELQAKALAYQVDGSLRGIDALLEDAATRIDPRRWPDPALFEWCRGRLAAFPEVRHMLVVGPDGQSIGGATTAQGVVDVTISIADREYWRYHQDHPQDRGMHIGVPVVSRVDGRSVIPLSRLAFDEAGAVHGAIVLTVDPAFLVKVLESVLIEEAGGAAVLTADGLHLARLPGHDATLGMVTRGPLFDELLPRAKSGVGRITALSDGNDKIIGYRTLDRSGLVVIAGITASTAFADWRGEFGRMLAVLIGFSGALYALASLFDRRTHSRALLAAQVEGHSHDLQRQLDERTRALEAGFEVERSLRAANLVHWSARQVAEAENEAKSRFLAETSHDLRQPLYAAQLQCEALAERLDGQAGDDVDRLANCLATLGDLLAEMADRSRADLSEPAPVIEPVSLCEAITRAAATHQGVAVAKEVRLRTVATRMIGLTDPAALHHVLLNLIANAVRYTDRGGVVIGCRRRGPVGRIEVWDSGRGIAAADLGVIFDEFRRVGAGDQPGSGLGLAIVERTARRLGHRVEVRSRPGRGSMFAVDFALAPAP